MPRAPTCPACAAATPDNEMAEYGRCEDCWVASILVVAPMPALLTAREAELLAAPVVGPTSVTEYLH